MSKRKKRIGFLILLTLTVCNFAIAKQTPLNAYLWIDRVFCDGEGAYTHLRLQVRYFKENGKELHDLSKYARFVPNSNRSDPAAIEEQLCKKLQRKMSSLQGKYVPISGSVESRIVNGTTQYECNSGTYSRKTGDPYKTICFEPYTDRFLTSYFNLGKLPFIGY